MKELHRGVLGHRIIHISISCNIHIQIHRFQFHIIIIKYFIFFMSATCAQRLTFRFRNFSVSRLCHFFRVSENLVAKKSISFGFKKVQVGGYMRSDNLRLACEQPSTSLQKRPLRLFQQVIWGDIWQLPLERNTANGSDRTKRTGHAGQTGHSGKKMIDVLTWLLAKSEI